MAKKEDLIKDLKEFKMIIKRQIPISKMLLFGSQASGKTHQWSDVDLIVVSKKFMRKRSFKRANKLYDSWFIDCPVDFLCYTPDEFNKLRKQATIVREAERGGIEI